MNEWEKSAPEALKQRTSRTSAKPADVHYWQYCGNCGTKLEGRKCKLICPQCGFYHSCSEP